VPVDAERWLAERGVRRDPIRVTTPADTPAPPPDPPDAAPAAGVGDRQVGDASADTRRRGDILVPTDAPATDLSSTDDAHVGVVGRR
jgi:hypothetical protein